jgi:hypothetical protein
MQALDENDRIEDDQLERRPLDLPPPEMRMGQSDRRHSTRSSDLCCDVGRSGLSP